LFDDAVAGTSDSERFVCVPGVTFSYGTVAKTRPQAINHTQMTRTGYET
jgi:hypothetical protein